VPLNIRQARRTPIEKFIDSLIDSFIGTYIHCKVVIKRTTKSYHCKPLKEVQMPNIEIKAHYLDLERGRTIAEKLSGRYLGCDHQIDTYFCAPKGRLKLRESSLSGAMLIPYMRANTSGPKKSDYALLTTEDPVTAKRLLTEMFGVEAIVEKRRHIYLIDNVRVHLDDVEGLGKFFELEAVYVGTDALVEQAEHKKVETLIAAFGVAEKDLIQGSYREAVNHSPSLSV